MTSLNGIGPSGAARLLVEAGDPARFPDKAHFASWNGTAPIDASSGDQVRHRLSRAGNRQINRVLHIMAVVQLRHRASEGRAYYDRKVAAGKTPREAMRSLKRRLSDIVYHQMVLDARAQESGPGRTRGGGYWLQRGRLAPRCRHFGEVTSRTHQRPYPSQAGPFFRSFRRPGPTPDRSRCQAPLCLTAARTGTHSQGRKRPPLDTEGSQCRASPGAGARETRAGQVPEAM